MSYISINRHTLYLALLKWEQDYRAGLTCTTEEHLTRTPEICAATSCESLWEAMGGNRQDDTGWLVLEQVAAERRRQDAKWGGAAHDDVHSVAEFVQLIEDYAGWARTMAGMDSNEKARTRLVQVAALAVAAIESIDRAMTRRVGP